MKNLADIVSYFDNGRELYLAEFPILGLKIKSCADEANNLVSPRVFLLSLFVKNAESLFTKNIRSFVDSQKLAQDLKSDLLLEIRKKEYLNYLKKIPEVENYHHLLKELEKCIEEYDYQAFLQTDILNPPDEEDYGVFARNLGDKFLDGHPYIKITHPEIYHLIKELILELDKLPESLQELIPFFNPKSIESSILRIKHIKHETKPFCYTVFNHRIDADRSYKEFKRFPFNFLAQEIKTYFQENSGSLYVKSEISKTLLMKEFIQAERSLLANQLADYKERYTTLMEQASKDAVSNENRIESLDSLNKDIEQLLDELSMAVYRLEQKRQAYQSSHASSLFSTHENLKKKYEENEQNQLDISYGQSPLPEAILSIGENACEVINVQKTLEAAIAEQIKNLAEAREILQRKQQQLKKEEKEAIKRWKHEVIEGHTIKAEDYAKKIKELIQKIHNITTKKFDITTTAEDLEFQLNSLQEDQGTLTIIQNALSAIRENIKNPAPCPKLLLQKEDGIEEEICKIYQDNCGLLCFECEEGLQSASRQLKFFSTELQKALTKARQNQLLESCKPELVKRIRQEKEEESKALQKRQKQIEDACNLCRGLAQNVLDLLKEPQANLNSILTAVIHKKQPSGSIQSIFNLNKLMTNEGVDQALNLMNILLEDKKGLEDTLTHVEEFNPPQRDQFTGVNGGEEYALKLEIYHQKLKALNSLKEVVAAYRASEKSLHSIASTLGQLKSIQMQVLSGKNETYEQLHNDNQSQIISANHQIQILSKISDFLELHEKVEQQLDELENFSAQDHERDARLKENLDRHLADTEMLGSYIAEISDGIQTCADQPAFKTLQANCEKLYAGTRERLDKVRNDITNQEASHIENMLRDAAMMAEDLRKAITSATEHRSSKASGLTKTIQAYDRFRNHLELIKGKLERLQSNGFDIRQFNEPLQELQDDKCHSGIYVHIDKVLKYYASQLRFYEQEVRKVAFTDDNSELNRNRKQLDSATEFINTITQSELKHLETALQSPHLVNNKKREEQLGSIIRQYNDLEREIKVKNNLVLRNTLCAATTKELDNYLARRNRKYLVKDWLSGADRRVRESAIAQLKEKLASFAKTGDKAPILNFIGHAHFPGLNFKPILNRLIIKLKEEGRHCETLQPERGNSHQEALEALENCRSNYQTAMKQIYLKINDLKNYGEDLKKEQLEIEGEVAIKLAQELEQKVDEFVLANGNNPPSQEAVKNFKDDFLIHLHSQDDLMSKHETSKSLIINIAAAVFTLGLALGIRLLVTKLFSPENRAMFFYDRSGRMERTRQIEKNLAEISESCTLS
ncbi:hypothetical protein [Legionella londiniensis]|nr:hypothetical protein [Legionella londiniensis]